MEAVNTDRRVLVRARIVHDDSPESPRGWDNLGSLITWTRDGMQYEEKRPQSGARMVDVRDRNCIGGRRLVHEHMRGESCAVRVELPASMHRSGTADGFVYASHADMLREYGRDTVETRETARKVLETETRTYQQWCDGDVYGRIIERRTLCALCAETAGTDAGCDLCPDVREAHDEATGHDYAPVFMPVPYECPHCEIDDDDDSCWEFYGLNVDTNGMADGLDDVAAAALREEAAEYRIEYGRERIRAEWHEAA